MLAEVGTHVVEAPVHNGARIVVEVFGYGQHRAVEVEAYRVVIDLLDGTGGHAL